MSKKAKTKTPKDKFVEALEGMGPSTEFMEIFDSLNAAQKRFWYHYLMGECTNMRAAGKFAGWKDRGLTPWRTVYSEKGRRLMGLYLDEFGITGTSLMAELHRINHADMADFEPLVAGKESLASLREKGVDTRQIKKFRITTTEYKGQHPHTTISTVVELYDRSRSIETQAQIRKLYDDEGTGKKLTPEQVAALLIEQSDQITTRPDDVARAVNGDSDGSNTT